jgi:hypothetical protein
MKTEDKKKCKPACGSQKFRSDIVACRFDAATAAPLYCMEKRDFTPITVWQMTSSLAGATIVCAIRTKAVGIL